MNGLRRHQLVWLNDTGWHAVLAQPHDPQASDCLTHWAVRGLPLVVTQQRANAPETLSLGLAAPARWGRRKIALQVPGHGVGRTGTFPTARQILPLLPPTSRAGWRTVCVAFHALDIPVHVHGSHGWQHLTGETCLREGSDLDLHVTIDDPQRADAAVALLESAPPLGPRLDGELLFADGAAVAWREWSDWRRGRVGQVLVKRLNGVSLETAVGAW